MIKHFDIPEKKPRPDFYPTLTGKIMEERLSNHFGYSYGCVQSIVEGEDIPDVVDMDGEPEINNFDHLKDQMMKDNLTHFVKPYFKT